MVKLQSLILVLVVSGCYSPKLGSPSFFCHPNDNPACPDGQKCVAGRCVNDSVVVAADFGSAPLDAGSGEDMNPGNTPSPDFSMPVDFSTQPDFAKPSCVATGGDCTYHNNAVCCSNYCIYSSNTCK